MNKNTQNGNAIIMILIAVALFAALGIAFSNSSRTSTSFIGAEETKAYANQIIAYGNEIKSTIKRLTLRGCSDDEISFENNIVAGYTNPSSPNDKSCHIFDANGGGLQFQSPPQLYSNTAGVYDDGKYSFKFGIEWEDNKSTCAGAACSELIMFLDSLDEQSCTVINDQLNYTTTPSDTTFSGSQFIGTYGYANTIADEAGGNAAAGQKSACFLRTADSEYIFVKVLIAR